MSQATAKSNQFFYIAVNAAGAKKMGLRTAPTEADLLGDLSDDRLLLLNAWPMPNWITPKSDISTKDQLALNEQLESLLNRGVPLTDALDVAASLVSTATKQRIEKMRAAVASGASFADACAQVGGFDDVTVTVYRAAEKSGDLAIVAGGRGRVSYSQLAGRLCFRTATEYLADCRGMAGGQANPAGLRFRTGVTVATAAAVFVCGRLQLKNMVLWESKGYTQIEG